MNISIRNKLVGLITVAGCSSYGIWHHRRNKNRTEFLVLDPSEAIQNLNTHNLVGVSIKSLEALYHLNAHKCEELTRSLNKAAWAQLIIYRSFLCRFLLLNKDDKVTNDESELNKLLQKVELDDKKWKKAIRWFSLNVCPDEDLRCQDSALEKPSKLKRMNNLLQVLLYKSEMENCDQLVNENVPLLLLRLINNYRDEKNKHLVMTAMKIMSNIAKFSEYSASHIANSSWLPLLAEMIVKPTLSEEPVLAHKVLANMLYSFGAAKYYLPSAVYELHRPNPDNETLLDVVFIHGFRGSLFRTWRQRDDPNPFHKTERFWPREWLPKEFKDDNVRILAIDYASKLLQFGELMDSVEQRAKKFKAALQCADVGSRSIAFCTHSMGGLVVKEMLSQYEDLLDRTVGILFMGTPHKGTKVISAYLNYLRPSEDTKLLQIESQMNQQLNQRFIEKADKVPIIVSIIEMEKSPLFGQKKIIVTPESSYYEGAVYHVKEHHYNICKPESLNSTSYCVITNFIKDALRLVKNNI